jgi:hypothetical protein
MNQVWSNALISVENIDLFTEKAPYSVAFVTFT